MKHIERFKKMVAVAHVLKQTGMQQALLIPTGLLLWLDDVFRMGCDKTDEEYEQMLHKDE